MKKLVTCFLGTVLMMGCGSSTKGKLLSPDKMQAVMWDVLQADAYSELYVKKDSAKNFLASSAFLQQKVFDVHHITKNDFYYSYQYYNDRPDEMRIILDSVSVKAERNRNNILQQRYKKYE